MRKKRAGSFGFWLFFLVLLSGTALYAGSIYVLFGAVSWFLVPLVSLLLNLGIRCVPAVKMRFDSFRDTER